MNTHTCERISLALFYIAVGITIANLELLSFMNKRTLGLVLVGIFGVTVCALSVLHYRQFVLHKGERVWGLPKS